ncbi:FadR/GntR family transcriptional regulator [Acidovorax sp. Root217]|uniref:FadR/GntR family transcriptional regulator n=1 Tax=Acidovorax sp. Root217 TaxID=1736492 RepID=UPI00070A394C|nr:FCD domain-containing protein [Acidovorax sp. Root217]KRC17646.1 GntR family transcriptional regulator [Acidovorax sp. Root217]
MPSKPAPEVHEAAVAPTFRAIRSTRAFEEVAAQIREELAKGHLKVGNRLPSERALSEQFGVARNTVREALRSLENAGLVRLQKGASGGAFISEGSGEAITTGMLDLYHLGSIQPAHLTEARIWLEGIIVREACLRATPADLQELQRNIEEAEDAIAQGDFGRRAEVHLHFHRILARMTGNPIMVVVMDGVLSVLRRYIESIGEYENAFVLPSRKRFMKFMEARDVEGSVAEMEASLKRLQRSYLSHALQAAQDAAAAAQLPSANSAAKAAPRSRAARKPA